MTQLNDQQIERYSRHILLKEVGGIGQRKLLDARVLIAGCGGLGSPAALYLAAAGVGTIGLVDHDVVDLTNLQRQIIHGTSRLNRPKTESAAGRMQDLNPDVRVITHDVRLDASNALDVLSVYDVILDGTDNFPSRYLINDACALLGLPLVHAGLLRFEGQLTFIHAKSGPCYRCLYPEPPPPEEAPTCSQAGILGPVAGVMGTLQATEALKYILGIGETLSGQLLIYNALTAAFRKITYTRDRDCALCGGKPVITELRDMRPDCSA